MTEITTLEQARLQTYGINAAKRPYRDGWCCQEVREPGSWPRYSQCARKNGFGPAGLYCKQHDPEVAKARKAAKDAKWEADYQSKQDAWARQMAVNRAMQGIANPEQAVAQAREVLPRLISMAEYGLPAPSHAGPCGPEAGCDANCMDLAHAAETLHQARAALAALTQTDSGK